MSKKLIIITLLVSATFIGVVYFSLNFGQQKAQIVQAIQNSNVVSAQANLLPIALPNLIEPVEGFRDRIAKKPFGIYITPETSPVQPDKFTGYHTGVDIEFTDSSEDIPVLAIADGTILIRAYASGYGGVVVVRHVINGVPIVVLYGHLDQASFLPSNVIEVKAGDQIGILGDDHSEETDGVRKHLHFSFHQGNDDEKIDFRGYVKDETELANWLNPLDFY